MIRVEIGRARGNRRLGRSLALPLLVLATMVAGASRADRLPEPIPGPAFALVDQNEEKITEQDLRGHVWVADFFFVQCGGPCPTMTQKMVSLAAKVTDPNVRFVCFSVDKRDTPQVLRQYAKERGATDPRIRFVTGTQAQIQALARGMLAVFEPATEDRPIMHVQWFMVMDKEGRMRATYNPLADEGIAPLVSEVALVSSGAVPEGPSIEVVTAAEAEAARHPWIKRLPPINAMLNGMAALFLCAGMTLVLARRYAAHATMMIVAFLCSAVFLACYLTLHYLKWKAGVGLTRFPESAVRPVYVVILTSHTILAVVVLPMIITTFVLAARRRWDSHRKWARPTFWIWLYVSVTGVAVYWMLYHLAPRLAVT